MTEGWTLLNYFSQFWSDASRDVSQGCCAAWKASAGGLRIQLPTSRTLWGFPRGTRPCQSSSSTPEELDWSLGESDNKQKWCPGTLWVTNMGHTEQSQSCWCSDVSVLFQMLLPCCCSLPVTAVALLCNQTWTQQPQSCLSLTVSPTLYRTDRIQPKGRKHLQTAPGACVDTISVIGHTHLQLSCPIKAYSSSFQRLLISSLNLSVLICMLLFNYCGVAEIISSLVQHSHRNISVPLQKGLSQHCHGSQGEQLAFHRKLCHGSGGGRKNTE